MVVVKAYGGQRATDEQEEWQWEITYKNSPTKAFPPHRVMKLWLKELYGT